MEVWDGAWPWRSRGEGCSPLAHWDPPGRRRGVWAEHVQFIVPKLTSQSSHSPFLMQKDKLGQSQELTLTEIFLSRRKCSKWRSTHHAHLFIGKSNDSCDGASDTNSPGVLRPHLPLCHLHCVLFPGSTSPGKSLRVFSLVLFSILPHLPKWAYWEP